MFLLVSGFAYKTEGFNYGNLSNCHFSADWCNAENMEHFESDYSSMRITVPISLQNCGPIKPWVYWFAALGI